MASPSGGIRLELSAPLVWGFFIIWGSWLYRDPLFLAGHPAGNVSKLATIQGGNVIHPKSFGYYPDGYAGAAQNADSGYFLVQDIDQTSLDPSELTHNELVQRARWLCKNSGFARGVINSAANMCSGLRPEPATTDSGFNRKAKDLFNRRCGKLSSKVFDVGGKFNFFTMQDVLMKMHFRDGDVFPIRAKMNNRPAVLVYESHQIGNGNKIGLANERWRNGVLSNRHKRPIKYRVLSREGIGGEVREKDLPAAAFMPITNPESSGMNRSPTYLYHAIQHIVDSTEITAFTKRGIKNASQIGLQLVRSAEKSGPGGLGSRVGRETAAEAAGREEKEKAEAEGKGKVVADKIFSGGEIFRDNEAGEELKTLLDQRPSANQMDFLDYLKRDIAAGFGLPVEVIWNMSLLGGANTRFVLVSAQKWVDKKQELLETSFVSPWYFYFIASEITLGNLPVPSDPNWWAHKVTKPARFSVDFGRDGRVILDQVRGGEMTDSRFYGSQGLDWEEEYRQRCEEEKRKGEICADVGISREKMDKRRGGKKKKKG